MKALSTVLSIAGSDSGGGAGIVADTTVIRDHGLHPAVAITAVTAQNTRGVCSVMMVDERVIDEQIAAVLDDMNVVAIKIGMLGTARIVERVADRIEPFASRIPIVFDPVCVATSGDRLTDENALSAMRERLWPIAALTTPNVPEALALTACDAPYAIEALLAARAPAPTLLTGGDLDGDIVRDVLIASSGVRVWEARRVENGPFHGTGCALSSAIASRLALGCDLETAVGAGIAYVQARLVAAVRVGRGSAVLGPAAR